MRHAVTGITLSGVQGTTHIISGLCLYATLLGRSDLLPVGLPAAPGALAVLAGGALVLGTLLPDIDHPRAALAQQRILGLRLVRPVSYVTHGVFGHRGFLHSGFALVFVALFASSASQQLFGTSAPGLALALGYGSHLLGDLLTPRGIPLVSPLSNRRFRVPLAPTGSPRELIFLGLVILVTVALCTHAVG